MVLTKSELIASFQNEVRILLHLAGKIEPTMIDYRPTPKQRSTIELLQYLTMMAPAMIDAIQAGAFDGEQWAAAEAAASARNVTATVAALAAQSETYATQLAAWTDAELRGEITMFNQTGSRGFFLVNHVLCACAAYRTQLFLYLKSCGREQLNTYDLWAGMDAPATV
jgi:hypothetical protein